MVGGNRNIFSKKEIDSADEINYADVHILAFVEKPPRYQAERTKNKLNSEDK